MSVAEDAVPFPPRGRVASVRSVSEPMVGSLRDMGPDSHPEPPAYGRPSKSELSVASLLPAGTGRLERARR